jgi:adenylosuccinate synthase
MPVSLVIGGQWGDEGKAKIVDTIGRHADYVVRFQGGANAGHTVIVGKELFKFHLVPSGILYPHITCILGGGMVIDPLALIGEIDELTSRGIDVDGRIFVSGQAHVVLPHHIITDMETEERQGVGRIGSTGKGIMPAYRDKIGRNGMRMCDFLLDSRQFAGYLSRKIKDKNALLRGHGFKTVSSTRTVERFVEARKRLIPLIRDTRPILWEALEKKKMVLFEGAQGTLLDIDHGTYPFVTSSSVSAGGVALGAGIPPSAIKRVIGVFKAYCTRVGNGPFPTEQKGRIGERLREIGHEYGTTTGRPRRCGWFDAVAARTAIKLNGITEIALTKLDVLDTFHSIRICTSYKIGTREVEYFPVDTRALNRARPRYIEVEGWDRCIGSDSKTLPAKARAYVELLEQHVGCKITMISLGPERRAMLRMA